MMAPVPIWLEIDWRITSSRWFGWGGVVRRPERRFEMAGEMEDCMDGKEATLDAGHFSYNADYGLVGEEGLDDEEGQDD